jgi:hypothetical protein
MLISYLLNLFFNQLFPNHGMSAFGTFYGSAFYTLLMGLFVSAFRANTITSRTKATAIVTTMTTTTTQSPAGTAAVSVSK